MLGGDSLHLNDAQAWCPRCNCSRLAVGFLPCYGSPDKGSTNCCLRGRKHSWLQWWLHTCIPTATYSTRLLLHRRALWCNAPKFIVLQCWSQACCTYCDLFRCTVVQIQADDAAQILTQCIALEVEGFGEWWWCPSLHLAAFVTPGNACLHCPGSALFLLISLIEKSRCRPISDIVD